MSDQLKDVSLKLLKQIRPVSTESVPKLSTQNEELDHTKEIQYAQLYSQFIDSIDDLLVLVNASKEKYDIIEKELDPVAFLHDLSEPPDLNGIDDIYKEEYLKVSRINAFYRKMLSVRKLASENALISLPILRAIHQIEGVTQKELSLLPYLAKRESNTIEILRVKKEIKEQEDRLDKLSLETQTKLGQNAERATYLKKLLEKKKDKSQKAAKDEKFKDLEEDLYQVKLRCSILAEFITALVTSGGLDWGNDEKLKDIVLFCGDDPNDEEET